MSTVNLGCKLDLHYITEHGYNVEWRPKKFNPVIMRLRKPKSTALIFHSGKIVVTGVRDEEISRIAARKFARIIQKLGFRRVQFLNFRISNIVASCKLPFEPPLFNHEFLPKNKMKFVNYNPELFPGLIYRSGVVIIVFRSGKVILTNAKTRQEIYDVYRSFENSINREHMHNHPLSQ